MLNVTDRLIVIIGGGKVAARKCQGLLAAGATRVRVVSPAFCDRIPTDVERITAAYDPAHLDDAELVFAATNLPAVNNAVIRDAHARGLFVNRADGSDTLPSDFSTPAVHREAAVVVTVSAAGSPALATRLRDQLTDALDRNLVALADAMRELRPAILNNSTLAEPQRRAMFVKLASDEAISVLRRGGVPALKQWLDAVSRATPDQPSENRNPQSAINEGRSEIPHV